MSIFSELNSDMVIDLADTSLPASTDFNSLIQMMAEKLYPSEEYIINGVETSGGQFSFIGGHGSCSQNSNGVEFIVGPRSDSPASANYDYSIPVDISEYDYMVFDCSTVLGNYTLSSYLVLFDYDSGTQIGETITLLPSNITYNHIQKVVNISQYTTNTRVKVRILLGGPQTVTSELIIHSLKLTNTLN